MNLFMLFAALALLSATASTPAFSETLRRQACHNHVSSRGKRTGAANQSWCIHNYSADEIDCSFGRNSAMSKTTARQDKRCKRAHLFHKPQPEAPVRATDRYRPRSGVRLS
jgi:hypothetical protein